MREVSRPGPSPAQSARDSNVSSTTTVVCGHADECKTDAFYVEQQNLTMRMGIRRFRQLTNAFSTRGATRLTAPSARASYSVA
jgi:hypothetical protein